MWELLESGTVFVRANLTFITVCSLSVSVYVCKCVCVPVHVPGLVTEEPCGTYSANSPMGLSSVLTAWESP